MSRKSMNRSPMPQRPTTHRWMTRSSMTRKPRTRKSKPKIALIILSMAVLLSLFAGVLAPYSVDYMNSGAMGEAPSLQHLFGTDNMGRDLLTLVLYGGRASLTIGILSAGISTFIATLYGTFSGMSNRWLDNLLMRTLDLFMSVPSILLVIVLQAIWGQGSYGSMAVIIGCTGWMHMAKLIRGEVRRLRHSDFVLAAEMYGGSFGYIFRRHLFPNYFASIMFVAVSNVGSAIILESTLSFMGLGLPISETSWGSLLSLSQEALLSDQWWMILIPGAVLISVLVSITEVGEYLRRTNTSKHSNI